MLLLCVATASHGSLGRLPPGPSVASSLLLFGGCHQTAQTAALPVCQAGGGLRAASSSSLSATSSQRYLNMSSLCSRYHSNRPARQSRGRLRVCWEDEAAAERIERRGLLMMETWIAAELRGCGGTENVDYRGAAIVMVGGRRFLFGSSTGEAAFRLAVVLDAFRLVVVVGVVDAVAIVSLHCCTFCSAPFCPHSFSCSPMWRHSKSRVLGMTNWWL